MSNTELVLKNNIGRPVEDILPRINLKHSKRYDKVERKLKEVFKFWQPIVEAKSRAFTTEVKLSKKYLLARSKVLSDTTVKPRIYNKFQANMEELYGEILDKYDLLSTTKKKRILRVKHPIKLIAKLTNLKFGEVFPDAEDNEDFKSILLTTSFSKDEVIKR